MAVADWAVGGDQSVLFTIGLGSCVAIALYDAATRIGGLAHVLLPSESMSRDRRNAGKFPSRAVPLLVEEMWAVGACKAQITAKIVGGARMFAPTLTSAGVPIGERNVLATRAVLDAAGIPVLAQDVGGSHGRSVFLHVTDGRVLVRSLVAGETVL